MSICYSATIGGTGTLIGTGPNIVLTGDLDKFVAFYEPEVDFLLHKLYITIGRLAIRKISQAVQGSNAYNFCFMDGIFISTTYDIVVIQLVLATGYVHRFQVTSIN